MATALNETRQNLAAYCVLSAAVLLVFGPSLTYPFVNYDDPHYVINNYSVQQGFSAESLRWAFTSGYAENWHPLTWLSHMLDFELYGMNPGAHRLTNLLLHLLSSLFLFSVLRAMTGAFGRSLAVAGLFAIHPLHVESVVWVAERKDVLCGLFWMTTLAAYAWWCKERRPIVYALLLLSFAAALLSKSMAVTLPFVLLLLDYWPLRRIESFRIRDIRPLIVEKLPLLALSAVFCIVTFLVQRAGGTMKTIDTIPLWARAANAVTAYGAYIWKAVVPFDLAVLYPHPGTDISWIAFALSLIVLAAFSTAAIMLRQRVAYLLVGWLWFLGTLVPVIGLVQVGDQAYADRYTYLPLIGMFIAISWGVVDLWERSRLVHRGRVLAYGASLVLVGLAAIASIQTAHWSSSIALFEHCVAVTPKNSAAHNNLGRAYHDEDRLDDAVHAYETALRLSPHLVMPRNNLALVHLDRGDFAEAERILRDALAQTPDDARMLLNLGIAQAALGLRGDAEVSMQRAVELMPSLVPAQFSLGALLVDNGNFEDGVAHLERVLALQPTHAPAQEYLARAYDALDNGKDAVNVPASTPNSKVDLKE